MTLKDYIKKLKPHNQCFLCSNWEYIEESDSSWEFLYIKCNSRDSKFIVHPSTLSEEDTNTMYHRLVGRGWCEFFEVELDSELLGDFPREVDNIGVIL